MLDSNLILNNLKIAIGVKTDNDLWKYLGISQSTGATWRLRNSINLEEIIAKCDNINLDWLLRGEGEMLRNGAAKDTAADNPLHIDIEAVKLLIAEKDRTIANLQEQLDKKDKQIDRLIQALSTPH